MTGRAEVASLRRRLDATFARATGVSAEAELLSDLARYLCVLVSGFVDRSVVELVLEHVRRHSQPRVQSYVEARLRRFSNANAQRLIELLGSFDPVWRKDLELYVVDERKDAIDSIVALRNRIAHGQHVGLTIGRVRDYYEQVRRVVDHIADLCVPVP